MDSASVCVRVYVTAHPEANMRCGSTVGWGLVRRIKNNMTPKAEADSHSKAFLWTYSNGLIKRKHSAMACGFRLTAKITVLPNET